LAPTAGLDDLVVPFAERTASRALVTLARGSVRPVPTGRYLRLFNHWTETTDGPQVDLDLSVALYDHDWQHVGTCDYTSLRLPGAVHSGDLTSAPGPLGASEFVDLDLDELAAAGARHAVVVILSYNNVPFTDVTARVTGTNHAVHRHHDKLALLGRALTDSFDANARVTLGELGRWHAATRTDEVLVRDGGRLTRYRRRPGETPSGFAARLGDPAGDGDATAADAAIAVLQFLLRGDLPTLAGADVYALHPAALDASTVHLLAAADLAAQLAPVPLVLPTANTSIATPFT
jgi:hypothetical protein